MNDRLINETCLSQSLSTDWECYNRQKQTKTENQAQKYNYPKNP